MPLALIEKILSVQRSGDTLYNLAQTEGVIVNDHVGDDGEREGQFVSNCINEGAAREIFCSILQLIISFIKKLIIPSKINTVIEANL